MIPNQRHPIDSKTSQSQELLNKVPEITIYFWIIKVLCTTVGETASDFLNINLNLGLNGTATAMGVLLAVILFFQLRAKKYIPGIYWLSVVLVSVFGTLLTDIMTDSVHIPLEASTVFFSIALAIVFVLWYVKEKTLSIHSVFTLRREAFYWLAILFTFALGTASGDLMAESLGLGYLVTGLIVLGTIIVVVVAWRIGLDEILAFWIAYILTRPLGASLGDLLTQTPANGGLGLGAAVTSGIFLVGILGVVIFLSLTRRDAVPAPVIAQPKSNGNRPRVIWQVVGVIVVLMVVSGVGYFIRSAQLASQRAANISTTAPLGDLSVFRKITQDTFTLVQANNLDGAKARVTDLETAWDNSQSQLKPMNPDKWSVLDTSIDHVLRNLRSIQPDVKADTVSLRALLDSINSLDPQH